VTFIDVMTGGRLVCVGVGVGEVGVLPPDDPPPQAASEHTRTTTDANLIVNTRPPRRNHETRTEADAER
jgi:hypothetical protein